MKKSIEAELLQHVIDTIQDQDLTDFEDLHFHAFNEDYYIIGYYNAEQWLKRHDVGQFEALQDVVEWKINEFGEGMIKPEDINAERVVNRYVYMLGEELLSHYELDQDRDELLKQLKHDLKQELVA